MTNKPILLELGNLRIIQYDDRNVEVQAYESKYNPFEKEEVENWRSKGYSSDVFSALKLILNRNMLVDPNAIKDVKTALNEYEKQGSVILKALDELRGRIKQ